MRKSAQGDDADITEPAPVSHYGQIGNGPYQSLSPPYLTAPVSSSPTPMYPQPAYQSLDSLSAVQPAWQRGPHGSH